LAEALAGALAGDEEGFRVLYRSMQPILLRYLSVLVGSDAADVASESWLQICRDLQRFSGDIQGFRAWSMTVARHRAMDHVRRMRRRPQTVDDEHYLTSLAASADTAAEVTEGIATAEVLRLVASLPRDQAEAVLLRAVAGLDVASAAKVLGKRPGAVRSAAHRGLKRLAEIMESPHG